MSVEIKGYRKKNKFRDFLTHLQCPGCLITALCKDVTPTNLNISKIKFQNSIYATLSSSNLHRNKSREEISFLAPSISAGTQVTQRNIMKYQVPIIQSKFIGCAEFSSCIFQLFCTVLSSLNAY